MTWPEYFPQDCPPQDVVSPSGVFYRVVADKIGRTLKKEHFESPRQSQRKRVWPPNVCECQLCGVSLLKTMEDSIKKANQLLALGRYRDCVGRLAIGEIEDSAGVMKHTPDIPSNLLSHHDWWVPEEIDPLQFFSYSNTVIENS